MRPRLATWALAVALTLTFAGTVLAGSKAEYRRMDSTFVADALCVHSGWHWAPLTRAMRRRGARADAWIAGRAYAKTWDVPDSLSGGSGEAAWHDDGWPYYNGLQFAPSTWERAGGSPSQIVSASPTEQVYRAWRIVRQDGGSWREWPQTARACGLRT